eukprot:GEZU01017532.1.p2 GENE.GEZU01017532.1~~GEZU01017532.1.p2  ORF type:complete len:117 (-),score=12.80 GEZU01017532.1:33-338(-)
MSDKKRGAETQLVKDQEEEDVGEITEESFEPGIKKADAETLKGRRIVKARRPKDSAAAKPATAAAANPFAAAVRITKNALMHCPHFLGHFTDLSDALSFFS